MVKEYKLNEKSGRQLFVCDKCAKSPTSKSRGFFYANTVRIRNLFYLVLTCRACKYPYHIRVNKPIEKDSEGKIKRVTLGTGKVLCYCSASTVFKVYKTSKHIMLNCAKCGKQKNPVYEVVSK